MDVSPWPGHATGSALPALKLPCIRHHFLQTHAGDLRTGASQVDIGYVPNQEAYARGNGQAVSARSEAGSGEKLVESAL